MNMRRERKFSLLKHKERKKKGRGKCVSRMKYFCIVDDLKKNRTTANKSSETGENYKGMHVRIIVLQLSRFNLRGIEAQKAARSKLASFE